MSPTFPCSGHSQLTKPLCSPPLARGVPGQCPGPRLEEQEQPQHGGCWRGAGCPHEPPPAQGHPGVPKKPSVGELGQVGWPRASDLEGERRNNPLALTTEDGAGAQRLPAADGVEQRL